MCHKIVGTRVGSRKQVEDYGFDARETLRILMCEQMLVFFFLFFFLKPLRKTALRLASISVVCDGPVRANPRMHPEPRLAAVEVGHKAVQ